MEKNNNLVIHRVPESKSADPAERNAHDGAFLKVLMEKHLGIKGIDIENKAKFIRRLGKLPENDDVIRPILLGLRFTADLELILDRTWMLAQSKNSTAEKITIVKDLTARQRQKEANMIKDACKKNLERCAEEVEQNLVYKVVGRKGAKREIRVPLRHGEIITQDGRVVLEQRSGQAICSIRLSPQSNLVKAPTTEKSFKQNSNTSAASGDWETATGKRGRPSPSPDKMLKKVRSIGVL